MVVGKHFEYFDSIDALLLAQEAENERLHKLIEQNGLDDFEIEENKLAWNGYMRVFHGE